MFSEGSSWSGLFSSSLEEFIIYSSDDFSGNLKNPNSKDYKLASRLSDEDVEAWNMWINKNDGILPNQYHYFYEQGDTIIFPEHLADLKTIDKMWNNRIKYKQGEEERKAKTQAFQEQMKSGQKVTTTRNQGGKSDFYGKRYRYNK